MNINEKCLHSSGGYEPNVAMRDFKECVQAMEVADVNSTGLHFTWNQKPQGSNGILKKIDRIMGNLKFNDDFLGSFAIFQPYRFSDHSPCEGFREIVDSGWNVHIEGYAMYRVVKRLKGLKSPFRKLLHNHGNLHDRVNKIRIELDEAQKAIDRDPSSSVLREEHAHYLLAFKEALLDEERFLQQKAKVEWLKAGDSNTSYFHKIVKSKCARNRIEIVSDSSNNFYDGNQVPGAFVKHYNQFLGAEGVSNPLDAHDLFIRVLDNSKADCMVRDVTDDEIKSVMFSMGDDRAPGPDGFTAAFFKKAWDVVGGDITCAIRDFFLQWPISCCNVLYKCISKIIANRVKEGLGDIVSINQSAFVPGRRISDNILLTQELMRNYHRRRGPPRCAFKVDIQKAYDTVDWKFLETILVGFGFHPKMVQWIMVCVSGASYSISVNGNVHGWFKGKRGLRQGDPLSPYLFTLVMEILTLLLQRKVRNSDEFQYHHLCEQQRIINLCFADDLFLFARGHPSSVSVIMDALEEFKQVSGLVPSIPKSTAYFCNVPNAIKASILNSMPFAEGVLSVRESLWVKWVHTYKLKGRSFWDVPYRGDASWGWRKLLQIRSTIRHFIWHKINNGKSTSVWFNRWTDVCSLKYLLSNRDIVRLGFSLENLVWSKVRILYGMEAIPPHLSDVVAFIVPLSKGKTIVSIISRIVVAATSYYIWMERNGRLFKKKTSTPGQIVDVIFSTVRLKLVTFKFKKMSTKSRLLLDQWKIPSYCIVHDGSTRRILVPESQAVNKSLESTKTLNTPESSKDSEAESLTPLPPLKNLQGASPSSDVMPLTFQSHSLRERPGLGIMKHTKPETHDSLDKSISGTVIVSETKPTTPLVPIEVKNIEQELKINELTKLVQMLIGEKVNSTQMTQESNSQIQQSKSSKSVDSSKISQDSKPKVQNVGSSKILYYMIYKQEDHRTSNHEMYTASLKRSENYQAQPYQPGDCRNYPECGIYGSYDHFTLRHNRVIHIRGGRLAESFQSSKSSIGVKCNTCGSIVHSTTNHNDFDHFKRETHQGAYLVPRQWMIKEYD
ncbi:hypothetical protein Tco_1438449 [Tanacetum coccineum]